MREEIMGIPFDNVTMEEALDAALRLLEKPGASYGVTPNSEIVYETLSDNALREIIWSWRIWILPDGAGVVLGAKILGTPLKEKVAGIDFAQNLMAKLEHTDRTFYFFGSKPGVAEAAADKLHETYRSFRFAVPLTAIFRTKRRSLRISTRKSRMCCWSALVPPSRSSLCGITGRI